jgi:hypothetical protein
MNMTNKQRKALWICLAIVVASYAVRSIILSAMQMQYYQQQAIRAAQQRAAAKARPAPSPRASSTPAAHGTPNTPASGSALRAHPPRPQIYRVSGAEKRPSQAEASARSGSS